MSNNYSSIKNEQYNEAGALQQLLQSLHKATAEQNARFDSADSDCEFSQFTITVDNVQTAFILGAPQFEALYTFVQVIAAENFYEVDVINDTVTD